MGRRKRAYAVRPGLGFQQTGANSIFLHLDTSSAVLPSFLLGTFPTRLFERHSAHHHHQKGSGAPTKARGRSDTHCSHARHSQPKTSSSTERCPAVCPRRSPPCRGCRLGSQTRRPATARRPAQSGCRPPGPCAHAGAPASASAPGRGTSAGAGTPRRCAPRTRPRRAQRPAARPSHSQPTVSTATRGPAELAACTDYREGMPGAADPAPSSAHRRPGTTDVGLATACGLPRRARASLGHEQKFRGRMRVREY